MAKCRDKIIAKVREMFIAYADPVTSERQFNILPDIEQDTLMDWMISTPASGVRLEGFLGHSAVVIECEIYCTHIEMTPSFSSDYKYMKNLLAEYYPDIQAQIMVT